MGTIDKLAQARELESKKIPVVINSHLVIYIRPGEDTDKARERYFKNHLKTITMKEISDDKVKSMYAALVAIYEATRDGYVQVSAKKLFTQNQAPYEGKAIKALCIMGLVKSQGSTSNTMYKWIGTEPVTEKMARDVTNMCRKLSGGTHDLKTGDNKPENKPDIKLEKPEKKPALKPDREPVPVKPKIDTTDETVRNISTETMLNELKRRGYVGTIHYELND